VKRMGIFLPIGEKGIFVHFWIKSYNKVSAGFEKKNRLESASFFSVKVRWLINLWGRDMLEVHMKMLEVIQEFGAI